MGGQSKLLPPSVLSFLNNITSNRTRFNGGLAVLISVSVVAAFANYRRKQKEAALIHHIGRVARAEIDNDKDKVAKRRVAVNSVFFKRLYSILKICVPGWRTKETLYIAVLTFLLVCKSSDL